MESSISNRMLTTTDSNEKSRPRTVILEKDKSGFGFTLRHFIVYPPASVNAEKTKQAANEVPPVATATWNADCRNKPMDTIFIREVKDGSPAHNAGLNKGDRIIAINDQPLSGKTYSDIIHLILKSGSTLRLLVVPKEEDILQLYFASSAYQPVDRAHNQHAFVPTFHPKYEECNQFYKQSSYGTYPGRIHTKSKSSIDSFNQNKKEYTSTERKDLCRRTSPHYMSPVTKQKLNDSLPENCIYDGICFSEDEELYHHAKELRHSTGEPKTHQDSVGNFYYTVHHNNHEPYSYSSEENLNCPVYMSDFDDIVHCDNMSESRSMTESLGAISGSRIHGQNSYPGASHSCDRVGGPCTDFWDSRRSRPGEHVSDFRSKRGEHDCRNKPGERNSDIWDTYNRPATCNSDYRSRIGCDSDYRSRLGCDSDYRNRPGERNSISCDFELSRNAGVPVIDTVNRCRQRFESGAAAAESLERTSLYRSELSRMTRPNHVQMVPSKTADYETKLAAMELADRQRANVEQSSLGVDGDTVKNEHVDSRNRNKNVPENSGRSDQVQSSSTEMAQSDGSMANVVHRRRTVPGSDPDECHIVRRISYLRATANERMQAESELSEEEHSDASSPSKDVRVHKLKSFFGEKTPKVKQALVAETDEIDLKCNDESGTGSKYIYGWVICKVVLLEGKRSSDRSWRHMWAVLRDSTLYLLKERREPSKGNVASDEHVINVKQCIANAANDYVKRKHVLRLLLLNGTEYLIQTESQSSMTEWLNALQVYAKDITEIPDWMRNTSVLEKATAYEHQIQKGKVPGHPHATKKLTVFRHRNPSDHSPNIKSRRASHGDELALTKIGVLWRDRMIQGWRKVHGMNTHIPKGASFGVKLENAPAGVSNEHVPLIIELCIQAVESKGLESIGIYRVPGNNASVSILTDLVNQGIDDEVIKDARWNDVNIVSSLLKAYFRKLPEPLLTSHLYPKFIEASETEDPVQRLKAIKLVLHHLPVHYFATLRCLMYHLKKVVEFSDKNKMEARNLAIVFGPTLVRSTDNNMVAMVTDMPQQCYLIETMIVYADWLFEECGDIIPIEINAQDKRMTHPPSTVQSNALLSNISKLDGNIGSRHLRHRPKKKDQSNYSKKRSGIIADDADIMAMGQVENLLSASFTLKESEESSSISETSSSLSKSLVEPANGDIRTENPATEETSKLKTLDSSLHRYDKLSAIANEKIRNFEQETRALLRREAQRPRTGSTQVEWDQIEKEWQRAKLELEQEDLPDFMDDPSYLACILGKRQGGERLSPVEEGGNDINKPMFDNYVTPKPLSHFESNSSATPSNSLKNTSSSTKSGCDAQTSKRDIPTSKCDIPTSLSQPALKTVLSDRTFCVADSKSSDAGEFS